MAKKYIANINGIKINLAILDESLQKDPDLMIKYICKTTKSKNTIVRPIVEKYFLDYKNEDIKNISPLEKKIKKFTFITKIISKIALALLILIAILVLICYFIAKFNEKDQLFLHTIFNIENYIGIIGPVFGMLKIIFIIFIITLILFLVFFFIRKKKYMPDNKKEEPKEIDFSEPQKEIITVEDVFKDED